MNIFSKKRKLLDEIASLNMTVEMKQDEIRRLRSANTDFSRILSEKTKKIKSLNDYITDLTGQLAECQSNREKEEQESINSITRLDAVIDDLNQTIDDQQKHIDVLKDTNNGLASSVTELKAKLNHKAERVAELKRKIEVLKQKLDQK